MWILHFVFVSQVTCNDNRWSLSAFESKYGYEKHTRTHARTHTHTHTFNLNNILYIYLEEDLFIHYHLHYIKEIAVVKVFDLPITDI